MCRGVEVGVWRCEGVEVWRWRFGGVEVWRCGIVECGGVDV